MLWETFRNGLYDSLTSLMPFLRPASRPKPL